MSKSEIHVAMRRLYTAATARGCIGKTQQQSALAALLNIAPQIVNNWESRGPSAAGLLAAQELTSINATWGLTGAGPMFIDVSSVPPLRMVLTTGDAVKRALSAEEASQWPFVMLDHAKIKRLRRDDVLRIEGAALLAAGQLGLDIANELAA